MPTLVNDPQPVELERLIERRRRLDQDRGDETWHKLPFYAEHPSTRC